MQVNKLRRDIETLTKDKRNAEMSQRKMSEEKTQLEEEVERLEEFTRIKDSVPATNEVNEEAAREDELTVVAE